jgi:hypothetical protein
VSRWDLGILRPGHNVQVGWSCMHIAYSRSQEARRYLEAAASCTGYFYLNLQSMQVWFALLSYHSDEGGRQCRTAGSPLKLGRLHGSMQVGPAACFDGFGSSGQQPGILVALISFRWHWSSQDGDKLGPLLVKLSADTPVSLSHGCKCQSNQTNTWTNSHMLSSVQGALTIFHHQNPNVMSKLNLRQGTSLEH